LQRNALHLGSSDPYIPAIVSIDGIREWTKTAQVRVSATSRRKKLGEKTVVLSTRVAVKQFETATLFWAHSKQLLPKRMLIANS
jgi:hypothetical protein